MIRGAWGFNILHEIIKCQIHLLVEIFQCDCRKLSQKLENISDIDYFLTSIMNPRLREPLVKATKCGELNLNWNGVGMTCTFLEGASSLPANLWLSTSQAAAH